MNLNFQGTEHPHYFKYEHEIGRQQCGPSFHCPNSICYESFPNHRRGVILFIVYGPRNTQTTILEGLLLHTMCSESMSMCSHVAAACLVESTCSVRRRMSLRCRSLSLQALMVRTSLTTNLHASIHGSWMQPKLYDGAVTKPRRNHDETTRVLSTERRNHHIL